MEDLAIMCPNGYVYSVVWRFEALNCQTATKVIRRTTLKISTISQMHYTRCLRFVGFHFTVFLYHFIYSP